MTALRDTTIGVEGLRACRLFAGFPDQQLDVLAATMRARRYRDGETIFHQDDPADSLHVVAEGGVKIVLPSAADAEPAILATIGPGEFFGALALLDDEPRSATAIALGPTQTLILRRETFLELIDEDRTLRRALLAGLAFEIRSITAHVHDLHFLDLPGRLAHRILREASASGEAVGGGTRVPWPYTQAELAGMIGASRQSVNRVLADLAARDLIRFERDSLVIPDPGALERSIGR